MLDRTLIKAIKAAPLHGVTDIGALPNAIVHFVMLHHALPETHSSGI